MLKKEVKEPKPLGAEVIALLQHAYDDASTTTRNPKLLAQRTGMTQVAAKTFLASQKSSVIQKRWTAPPVGSAQYSPTGAPAGHWQADVIFFKDLKSKNQQNIAILTVLNTTSRYALARPVKSTTAATVVHQMKDILDELKKLKKKITHMRVDGGAEFKKETRVLFNTQNITVDQAEPKTHYRIRRTDAFHRTLRHRLGEHFERKDTNNWINVLQETVHNINISPHAAMSEILGREVAPKDITEKDEIKIREHEMRLATASHLETDRLYPNIVMNRTRVRLLVAKTKDGGDDKFSKSHRANWTDETYKILARNGPNSFLIDIPQVGRPDEREIKIWPAHSLLFLTDAQSEIENNKEPVMIMGTGGKMTNEVIEKTKKSTRVNLKAASAKRMEAVERPEAEQRTATLQYKRRPTITTRSKASPKVK